MVTAGEVISARDSILKKMHQEIFIDNDLNTNIVTWIRCQDCLERKVAELLDVETVSYIALNHLVY